jgi:outer membrane protein assembly factor BamA
MRRTGFIGTLLLLCILNCTGQYKLSIVPVDHDSAFFIDNFEIQRDFIDRSTCLQYIDKIPGILQAKGYPTASVDSIWFDSTQAGIRLFAGAAYKLAYINMQSLDKRILEQAGWNEKTLYNKPLNISRLHQLQEKILRYFEDNGYPFAKIQLDSMEFNDDKLKAVLRVDKGHQYKIDSISIMGAVKINNIFLQRYLDIKNGSTYQKSKLENINKRLLELPYIQQSQAWNLTMLGTGSVLNLYLKPKKSSQINVLVGFLPANQIANNGYEPVRPKLLFTGEATINLRNAMGNGELIGLDWQQLQQSSPRLNLQYQQPYLFGSPFGVTTSFDLFKKDSAYLNINFLAGIQYALSLNQTGKIFIQTLNTNLLTVDTNNLRITRKLPNQIDLSTVSLGIDYLLTKTNYKLNPRKGYELQLTAAAGTRNIKKNSVIAKLTDPDFTYASLYDSIALSTYQFRIKTSLAKYFPVSRSATLKTAISGGWYQSPNIFRNELFQFGGYKLMRGFDEESIFASQYAVSTVEYRYLIGLNSYFFTFADLGWANNQALNQGVSNTFIGAGIGLALETKAGIFNISFANGKRNDTKFDFRQSKIHLGYVSYF